MFMLYFGNEIADYDHVRGYQILSFGPDLHPGECLWLIPGTDPDDPAYN